MQSLAVIGVVADERHQHTIWHFGALPPSAKCTASNTAGKVIDFPFQIQSDTFRSQAVAKRSLTSLSDIMANHGMMSRPVTHLNLYFLQLPGFSIKTGLHWPVKLGEKKHKNCCCDGFDVIKMFLQSIISRFNSEG